MNLEDIKEYCKAKKGVKEDFPFDDTTLVMKVGSKMFLLTDINSSALKISLKCDPFISIDLRRDYKAVEAGYHLNKKHWNTVTVGKDLDDEKIKFLIDISYDLVFKGLTKKEKETITK
ncbi:MULTISPECIES: MmcQ/YjbR family DNA-binding protein [Clostridium]|uniref:MmcQ/YjbR family DNA-binding protein n=1 Tax=Clostridium TaxID=1485 RepID=UPI000824DA6B|nr:MULTISPECIES: MmcQ/YjbR family DNA-binding protein [Clostridium]PJI08650.1 MmcQ-like protein [Clostridium sp. CT7]